MVAEAIGIGIVIGVAGVVVLYGLCKLADWCYRTSENIKELQRDSEWATKRRAQLVERVNELKKSSDDYLEHGKVVIETLALTHSRLGALETWRDSGEEIVKEKPSDN